MRESNTSSRRADDANVDSQLEAATSFATWSWLPGACRRFAAL
jgi:hypothetical protein